MSTENLGNRPASRKLKLADWIAIVKEGLAKLFVVAALIAAWIGIATWHDSRAARAKAEAEAARKAAPAKAAAEALEQCRRLFSDSLKRKIPERDPAVGNCYWNKIGEGTCFVTSLQLSGDYKTTGWPTGCITPELTPVQQAAI